MHTSRSTDVVPTRIGFFMAFWVKDRSRLSRKRDGRGGIGAAHARPVVCVLWRRGAHLAFALGAYRSVIGASSFWRTWRPHAHHFSADSLFRFQTVFRSKPKSHKHDKKVRSSLHCLAITFLCLNIKSLFEKKPTVHHPIYLRTRQGCFRTFYN